MMHARWAPFVVWVYLIIAVDSFNIQQLLRSPSIAPDSLPTLEKRLLGLLEDVEGRGAKIAQRKNDLIMATIRALEARKGIPNPTSSKAIEGEWKLLYTTTTNTASPIQRSFVGNKQFSVVQDIRFFDLGDSFVKDTPTVSNIVRFGENIGQLRVTAVASTGAKPLPGFTPRQGDGRILGLNVFGVSSNSQSQRKFSRIDFQFVDAAFEFTFLPFTIPYPVPFRILGDEAKGWIDITYLSPMLRVARGNKGTTFVLQKQ